MVLAAAALMVTVRVAAPVLVPVLVSILLAYALEPLIAALATLRLPRPVAAIVVFVLLGLTGVGVARAARTQVNGFLTDLPQEVANLQRALATPPTDGFGFIDQLKRAEDEFRRAATPGGPQGVARVSVVERRLDLRRYLLGTGYRLLVTGFDVFTIVVLTFLLVATGDLFRRRIVALAGPRLADRKITVEVLSAIDRQIERYLQTRVLISTIIATATATAMWTIGLEHPVIWGLVAGVLNVLPYVGPMTATALITLAAFLQFKTLEMTGLACGLATIIAAVEGNLITPWLTSRAGDLNTVAVMVALLFWGWMWGVWGLLLAVPILVTVKAASDHIDQLKPLGELVSN